MRRLSDWRLVLGLILLLGFPTLGAAHTHLEKSSPEKGAQLDVAPAVVELWFSGKVSAEWSSIEVHDGNGQRFDEGKVTQGDDAKRLQAALKPLAAGGYEVKWSVVSGDGHRVKGSYSFTVK